MIPLRCLLQEYAGLTPLAANTLRLHQFGVAQFGKTLGAVATTDHLTDANLSRHAGAVRRCPTRIAATRGWWSS